MSGYKTISWFSAGVSSAVATKLALDPWYPENIISRDEE